jgi:hypothetical protein
MIRRIAVGIPIFLALLLAPAGRPVRAQSSSALTVLDNTATLKFPSQLTFHGKFQSAASISSIVLEYGSNTLACAPVVGKAFPAVEPAQEVETEWSWNMEASDSVPPGGRIHWQWRITDSAGVETLTDVQEVLWLDSTHAWQEVRGDSMTVHYYRGGTSFGTRMKTAAEQGLKGIQKLTSLLPDGRIDVYLYSSYDDLRAAVYNEPQWTGGLAYGEYNLLLLGIPPGSEDWGEKALAHELTHVLAGRFMFSCLGSSPAWLDEGLAMVNEGELDATSKLALDLAILQDKVFSVRSLSGGFPEDSAKASLAYSESWSIVHFLFQKGGSPSLRNLMAALRDGTSIDDALQNIYGFNVDGLDAAWRASVRAPAHTPAAQPNRAQSTAVPTFQPAWLDPNSSSSTEIPVTPTQTASSTPEATPGANSSSNATITLLVGAICTGLCCSLILLLIISILIFSRRRSA